MKHKKEILVITEMSIFIAIAVVLDTIFGLFSPFKYGGSISPAMLPIFVIAYRRGWKNGMIAGIAFGIIQSLVASGMGNFWFLSLPQYLLDYIVPFMVLGLAGIFPKALTNKTQYVLGMALASFLRYLSHGFAGIVFWKDYAPEGVNYWFYSFVLYNLPYMVASFALCLVIGIILYNRKIIQVNLY
ncbi:MAG: energy-coupled thiamine transporter ThiT [Candidatus Izemoplasmatales bacterium]|jgi:thiamine transporter|nr:energy-coupled thiamine transporter ThiT [Candidatus Izemoplasmatales bacterium]